MGLGLGLFILATLAFFLWRTFNKGF